MKEKFKKEFLKSVVWNEAEGAEKIRDEIIDHTRWSVVHLMVFKYKDKFYETSYSQGATEQQDESPYEYDNDVIECTVVQRVEKTTFVYEEI